jgi:hypothetical protein
MYWYINVRCKVNSKIVAPITEAGTHFESRNFKLFFFSINCKSNIYRKMSIRFKRNVCRTSSSLQNTVMQTYGAECTADVRVGKLQICVTESKNLYFRLWIDLLNLLHTPNAQYQIHARTLMTVFRRHNMPCFKTTYQLWAIIYNRAGHFQPKEGPHNSLRTRLRAPLVCVYIYIYIQ